MAEQEASDFTALKTKEKKDDPSNVDTIVSPRKSARTYRSKKRKEEVQKGILSLSRDAKLKGLTDPLLDIDVGGSEKEGNTTASNKTDVTCTDNTDTSASRNNVKTETPRNRKKGRQSKKSLADGERSFLDSFTDTSLIADVNEKVQDTSIIESEINGKDIVTKDTQESKPKRKRKPKQSAANSINSSGVEGNDSIIQGDDSLIVKSEFNINETVTEMPNNKQTKPKRKCKPKKNAVSPIDSSIDESYNSIISEDAGLNLNIRTETNSHEIISETPNEHVKPKRKGRAKKTVVSPINTSVDDNDISLVDGNDSLASKTGMNDDSIHVTETPGNERLKPKKRGRAKKIVASPLDSSIDETNTSAVLENNSLTVMSEIITSENIADTPKNETEKPKRKGRPKGSATKKKHFEHIEVNESNETDTPKSSDTPKSRRKARINYASLNESGNDKVLVSTPKPTGKIIDDSMVRESTSKCGRKRKRVDYAALSKDEDQEEDDDTDDYETPIVKRRRTKAKEGDDDVATIEAETPKKKTPRHPKEPKSTGKAKITPKEDPKFQCSRCEEISNGKADMKRHMALKHQALWTPENPEGLEDSRSLNQVIKIKKFLNCPKCGKQLNFLQYYKTHLEWCGRDFETYTCPICEHEGLLAKWRDMHMRECQRNKMQKEEATKRSKDLKTRKEEDAEEAQDGEKKKRRAATKATTMLQNLSKDKDLDLGNHDDSDNDKDFDATRASDEDEVAEEFEEDEEEEEEEFEEDEGLIDEGVEVETGGNHGGKTASCYGRFGKDKDDSIFFKYLMTYDLMNKLVKKQMSTPLYTDLMPDSKDWSPAPESEYEKYLPSPCHSISFTFSKKEDKLQSLGLYEAVTYHNLPMFFTGLSVWKMAWCPNLREKQAAQYLAIVGKADRENEFRINTRIASPGLIQIWHTGIKSNKIKTDISPKLAMNIIHDYGTATDIKWCPSGCWQEKLSQPDDTQEVLPRMGLLACSFTDSTVRVFSVPNVPCNSDGSVPTYRPPPVMTLVPNKSWESGNITCSCLDWQSLHGHKQIIAGYSDGTIRVFNLMTSSPLQLLKPLPNKVLLPFRSFQAHNSLVRSCAWLYRFEDRVMTAGEDTSTYFWDLKDTDQPFNSDNGFFMPLRVINSVMLPGAITSSDNCYSISSNKTRYLDPATLYHNREARNMVFATTQSACTWDISYSNWLNFVIACDSRGTVEGTAWFDLSYQEADTKTYKHRLRITEAKVKWKSSDDSPGTDDIKCQSESCNKCASHSKTTCDSESENVSQNDSDISQSEQMLENNKLTSQSTSSTQQSLESAIDQTESSTETSPTKGAKLSDHNRTLRIYDKKTKDAKWKHRSMLTLQSLKSNQSTQRKKPNSYSEMLEQSYLEFSEHLTPATKKRGPTVDPDFDVYDRVFVNSLHSIACNPNKHACFWVAYGGEAGLVRLVNLGSLLPKKFRDYYNYIHQQKDK